MDTSGGSPQAQPTPRTPQTTSQRPDSSWVATQVAAQRARTQAIYGTAPSMEGLAGDFRSAMQRYTQLQSIPTINTLEGADFKPAAQVVKLIFTGLQNTASEEVLPSSEAKADECIRFLHKHGSHPNIVQLHQPTPTLV